MIPRDHELLDTLHELRSTLDRRIVLLRHLGSDVDVYAEGLRDLGNDLFDLGAACLDRVSELDNPARLVKPQQSERAMAMSCALNELALDIGHDQ